MQNLSHDSTENQRIEFHMIYMDLIGQFYVTKLPKLFAKY